MTTNEPTIPAAEPTTEAVAAAPPRATRALLRDVAVGAVATAGESATELLAAAGRITAPRSGRPAQQAAALVQLTRRRIVDLAERGAAEQLRGRRRLADLVDAVVVTVASAPVVNRMVDVQVDRVLRPAVATVLDDVLALLEGEPERVQSLIRGQRDSMVDELLGRIRTSTAAGDVTVDRWTGRMMRRTGQPAEVPSAAPRP